MCRKSSEFLSSERVEFHLGNLLIIINSLLIKFIQNLYHLIHYTYVLVLATSSDKINSLTFML